MTTVQPSCAECNGTGQREVAQKTCAHSSSNCPCDRIWHEVECETCRGSGGTTCADCGEPIEQGAERGDGDDPQCAACQADELESIQWRAIAFALIHETEQVARAFNLSPPDVHGSFTLHVPGRVLTRLVERPHLGERTKKRWGYVRGTNHRVAAWEAP